jgi:ribosomal protein L11 methyltransferase
MAFGTGLHPTTRLGLSLLEDLVRPGDVVLDLGTGSGILAIAAARLGATWVAALDTDTVAVEAARANVAANGVQDVVQVGLGSLGPKPRSDAPVYDLVVANIIAKVLCELAVSLSLAVRPACWWPQGSSRSARAVAAAFAAAWPSKAPRRGY